MSVMLPHTQTLDPLANAYAIDDCIVLNDITKEWKNEIERSTKIFSERSKPLASSQDMYQKENKCLYFPDKGVWECHVHINIACVTLVKLLGQLSPQTDTIIKYLALTAKCTSTKYKIVNRVGFELCFYISKDILEPRQGFSIRGFRVTDGWVTMSRLEEPIERSREYRYTLIFDDRWDLIRDDSAPRKSLSNEVFPVQATKNNKEEFTFKWQPSDFSTKPVDIKAPDYVLPFQVPSGGFPAPKFSTSSNTQGGFTPFGFQPAPTPSPFQGAPSAFQGTTFQESLPAMGHRPSPVADQRSSIFGNTSSSSSHPPKPNTFVFTSTGPTQTGFQQTSQPFGFDK